MNTPSHWLMTVVIGKFGRWKAKPPRWALGLGAIAPDFPLYMLSAGGILYFGQHKQWPAKDVAEHLFQNLYYQNPVWITLHNFLHSPLMLILLIGATLILRIRFPRAGRWGLFFLGACLLHSVVDIVTHNDDGPLLLFPIDWNYRFSSPVSYWDPDHYGRSFMVFEAALDLILSGLVLSAAISSRKDSNKDTESG